MDYISKIEQQIVTLLSSLDPIERGGWPFDTCYFLCCVAEKDEWVEEDYEGLDFLSKRLEISKKVYLGYDLDGKKRVTSELIEGVWLELFVAVLFKASCLEQGGNGIRLKRFNTLFKVCENVRPNWLSSDTELGQILELLWSTFSKRVLEDVGGSVSPSRESLDGRAEKSGAIIPIAILFYDGPIARAYLETLSSLGLKPQKIIELVSATDLVSGKPVGRWLPESIRIPYSADIHRSKIHYWPKRILKERAELVDVAFLEIEKKLHIPRACLYGAQKLFPLTNYCENIETLLITSLRDRKLFDCLSGQPAGAILYTGGGIVPESLLEISHLKFIHVHPGFLPDIRGADCTLWSILLSGHTSASCFYMSPGIDTGDIIRTFWLPKLLLDIDTKKLPPQLIYRLVYSFLDPWVRAYVLRCVIEESLDFSFLKCAAQNELEGITYHFMHQKIRDIAYKKLFQKT